MDENMDAPKYKDHLLSIEVRVDDLVSRMSLAEKISQMGHESAAIPRLDIPAYNWWSEALHGVSRAGIATVFPQAIGLAATFSQDLIYQTADIISTEARVKYHESLRLGDRSIFKGLTLWCPNINIFRDPRWGRGHETYGEDPYLTSRIGVAFVKGLQGEDEHYLKTVATPKHAFAHSGPESVREGFDSKVSKKDLWDTYLPAFKACIQEGKVASIMTAYNRLNGEPCSASHTVIEDIVRKTFGFTGFVVSDCGAVCNIHEHHKVTNNAVESVALAVNSGLDLNCGYGYKHLGAAVATSMVSEEKIDDVMRRLFTGRFKLGMFDPDECVPFANIPYEMNDCEAHREFSRQVSRESIVLLKNKSNCLPLGPDIKTIAVIGPNADNREVLLGNYNGHPSRYVTVLDGIRNKVNKETKVLYTKGCSHTTGTEPLGGLTAGFSEAISMAERADVVVLCLGLTPQMEGEKGDAFNSDEGGDKPTLDLPEVQQQLLEAICATGKMVICVLISGSALAVNWMEENVPAIMQAFYPGQEGGNALADIIFGDYCPSGRLPVTFYKTTQELPAFDDYSMKNRTYRYMKNEALYPFGFGLSYNQFNYDQMELSKTILNAGESIEISVKVTNAGQHEGAEVVQLYVKDLEASTEVPRLQLQGIQKVLLNPNETRTVSFTLSPRQMAFIDDEGKCILEPGKFTVYVGGTQPECEINSCYGLEPVSRTFTVVGEATTLIY